MIGQLICAVCTLGVVILAILITTKAISLDDALKAFGKVLLMLIMACLLVSLLGAGWMAFTTFLKTVIRWIFGVVLIIAATLLFVQAVRWRLSRRLNADDDVDR